MYLETLKHSVFRRELTLKLYRRLLKQSMKFPDPLFSAFYTKLFKEEFHKF